LYSWLNTTKNQPVIYLYIDRNRAVNNEKKQVFKSRIGAVFVAFYSTVKIAPTIMQRSLDTQVFKSVDFGTSLQEMLGNGENTLQRVNWKMKYVKSYTKKRNFQMVDI